MTDHDEIPEAKVPTLDFTLPVCTVERLDVKILYTEGPDFHYPIIGLVEGQPDVNYWSRSGRAKYDSDFDLIQKEAWFVDDHGKPEWLDGTQMQCTIYLSPGRPREIIAYTDPEYAPLIANAPTMRDELRAAAKQFRYYEIQHLAKNTPESRKKAEVNRTFARRIEALLAKVEGK